MKYGRYAKFEKVKLTLHDIGEWLKTSEYSASMPTGVIPGKKWRRFDGDFDPTCDDPAWLLCEYSEAFIGDDGHERCKILMKRAVIRAPALTDAMFVIKGKEAVQRTIEIIPREERVDKNTVRLTELVFDYCMDTFGYLPDKLVEGRYMPLDPGRREPIFILKFHSAKDALVFKMWFA